MKPKITPKEDLMNSALKHYEEAASAIHHWNSDIPKAIKAFYSPSPEQSLPSDEMIERIARETCSLANSTTELGFYAMFDLSELRLFVNKLCSQNKKE